MKEALKLALEALEMHVPHVYKDRGYGPITAIKEALAQPEQKPSITKTGCGILTLHSGWDDLPDGTKFYTTPPKRPWVGLTDEEIDSLQRLAIDPVDASGWGFLNRERYARLIEAKLKELNT